jgi:integrase
MAWSMAAVGSTVIGPPGSSAPPRTCASPSTMRLWAQPGGAGHRRVTAGRAAAYVRVLLPARNRGVPDSSRARTATRWGRESSEGGEPRDRAVHRRADVAAPGCCAGHAQRPSLDARAVLGLRQGEVLGLQWADLDLTGEGTVTVRRQLQRLGWQHACETPSDCRTVSGTKAKRGADCPQRTGGGLVVRPVKSTAGRRALTLPASLTAELRAHRRTQVAERLSSEIWEEGPGGGWLFADEAGGPLDPRADLRAFKELCTEAGLPSRRLHDLRHSAATMMQTAIWI